MERVADYIIRRLTDMNIKHVFMITGRGILFLTDAVAKNKDIEGICTYHEQGASYAAMAYAAASDGMSACLVSTGCAATNAVTAALCAWQDNLPCVFISGQHMLNETTRYTGVPIRTFGSQEADIIEIVKPITKYSVMITDPYEVALEMDKAFLLANTGRKGPVWIDIPLDIQNARIESDTLIRYKGENQFRNSIASKDINKITHDLQEAKRPVIFIGGGVRSAGAVSEIKQFIEKHQIPLVFSTAAADTYGSGNYYSIGAVGSLGGSRAGNFTVQNADYILAIGTKLCSQSIGADSEQFAREAKITVIDIDKYEHTKVGAKIDQVIIADAKDFLERLNASEIHIECKVWLNKCLEWKNMFSINNENFIHELTGNDQIDLYYFADKLSDMLSADTTVITDAGLEELIIPSAVRFRHEQRCLFPAAQGAMGYAIPAIIGAYYAGKNSIVTVVGDGSIMMNMQELQIIGSYKIPAKIFVINNNMYAVIRKRQKDLFRTRTIGNDPSDGVPAPDFKKIASCFDISYRNIDKVEDLDTELTEVLQQSGPCICEIRCKEDQKYLHMSFIINEKHKLVKRPLEDLSPFLDRELIKSEMIIEPAEE